MKLARQFYRGLRHHSKWSPVWEPEPYTRQQMTRYKRQLRFNDRKWKLDGISVVYSRFIKKHCVISAK